MSGAAGDGMAGGADLEAAVAAFLADDPPERLFVDADALLALWSDADELAELDATDSDAPDGTGVRVLAFLGTTHSIAVAIDTTGGLLRGQIVPPHRASVVVMSVAKPPLRSAVDDSGGFELAAVPAGPVQLVMEPVDGDLGPSVKTEWSVFKDVSAPSRPSNRRGVTDGLLRRRLAARAAEAADRDGVGHQPGPPGTAMAPHGCFEPPVAVVSRTLAPAAQHGTRPMPRHRWVSDDDTLDVALEETRAGRLTITVSGTNDLDDDVLVAIDWSTATATGDSSGHGIVTPLPSEPSDRRAATYDVGSALDLRTFGLADVRLVPLGVLSPDVVEHALACRPFGSAIRAWDELTARLGVRSLREALERNL